MANPNENAGTPRKIELEIIVLERRIVPCTVFPDLPLAANARAHAVTESHAGDVPCSPVTPE